MTQETMTTVMRRLSIFALCLFSACGAGGGGGSEDAPDRVRLIHAAPNYENLDIYIDEDLVAAGISYGDDSGYLEALEGTVQVRVTQKDEALDLINEEQTITAGKDQTLAIIEEDDVLVLLLVEDDNTEPEPGQGNIRIAHLAPSLDQLDIYITRPGVDISDATPAVTTIEFKSFSEYLGVNEGSVEIRVTNNDSERVIAESGTINLVEGQVATFFILDEEGGGTPAETVFSIDR